MKHLIIFNTIIYQIGNTYSQGIDDLDETRFIHIVDEARYDQNFEHVEVASVPDNISVGDKYENGEFIKVDEQK